MLDMPQDHYQVPYAEERIEKDNKLPQEIISYTSYNLSSFSFNIPLAAKIAPPPHYKNIQFRDLPCSQQDIDKITEIVTTLGTKGKFTLLRKKKHLEKLGAELSHLHPYTFLAVVCTNPNLKQYLNDVMHDMFVRINFLSDFTPRLDLEKQRKTAYEFLEDFSEQVNAQPNIIKTFVDKKNWKEMLYYLTSN